MDGDIWFQVYLVDASEGTQKISQPGPESFDSVYMNFTNSISIIITRPNTFAWRMIYGGMNPVSICKLIIRLPFVGIDGCAVLGGT